LPPIEGSNLPGSTRLPVTAASENSSRSDLHLLPTVVNTTLGKVPVPVKLSELLAFMYGEYFIVEIII
jgi:hypothetical protein